MNLLVNNWTLFSGIYKRQVKKIQRVPWQLLRIPTVLIAGSFLVAASIGGNVQNLINMFNAYCVLLLAVSFTSGISASSWDAAKQSFISVCKFVMPTFAMIYWGGTATDLVSFTALTKAFLLIYYFVLVSFGFGLMFASVLFPVEKQTIWTWKSKVLWSIIVALGCVSLLFPNAWEPFVLQGLDLFFGVKR